MSDTGTAPRDRHGVLTRLYRNEIDIPFPKYWKPMLIVSALLVLISVGALFERGLSLGLEFEGGAAWELPAPGVSTGDARDVLRDLGLADARVQTGDDVLRVRAALDADDAQVVDVTRALADLAGVSETDVSVNTAGPSWGQEITDKAIQAIIVFSIVITLYITIRLRWQMAFGALVSVAHDLVISVGFYSLFQIEVTPSTVIAFLTILGFSLYDTLVVFDKVRDNEHRMATAKLSQLEMMNLSLNQVLMRSVNTTVTSIIPVISVLVVGSLIKGAVTLQEFGIALLVGLVSGAYSSVFVAAPVAVWIGERWGSGSVGSTPGHYRLSEAVRRHNTVAGRGPTPAAPSGSIPPRPRKQKRR